jgi:hypothetical protein
MIVISSLTMGLYKPVLTVHARPFRIANRDMGDTEIAQNGIIIIENINVGIIVKGNVRANMMGLFIVQKNSGRKARMVSR